MPRFNPHTAEALMGIGNGPLSVDGREIRPNGGGPSVWLNVDTVLHQANGLASTNIRTNVTAVIGPGMNEISGGCCETYLAWTAGIGIHGTITLASGGLNRVITDGRGANSSDGCLVYIPDRQASGPTIVRHPNGTEHHLPDMYGMHLLRWGQAVWNSGNGTLGFWGETCEYLPGAAHAKLAELNGELWLVYFLEGTGLIAHCGTAPSEYHLITSSSNCFHPDVLVRDNKLAVCYSTTSGEGPGHLVKVMDVQSCPSHPFESTIPDIEIPDVNRAVWFTAYDTYGDGSFPRNCAFDFTFGGQRIFHYATGDPDGDPDAIYRAVQEIKDKIARGEFENKPVCPYVPHGVAFPSNADWIGIECYWKKPLGETIESYESSRQWRIHEAARPVILIPQTYFSNANNAGHPEAQRAEIRQIVPVIARLTRDNPAVQLVAVFSAGSWRGTGYDDPGLNSYIAPLWEQMASTISSPENGNGNGNGDKAMQVKIIEFPSSYRRDDPKGLPIFFEVSSDTVIVQIEVGLKNSFGDLAEKPFIMNLELEGNPDDKDGRYLRQIAWKPVTSGNFHPYVKATDEHGNEVVETASNTVEVTSPL